MLSGLFSFPVQGAASLVDCVITFPGVTGSFVWARIDFLGNSVLNTTTGTASVTIENAGNEPCTVTMQSRAANWGNNISSPAVTIASGESSIISISDIPAGNTLLLLNFDNISSSASVRIKKIYYDIDQARAMVILPEGPVQFTFETYFKTITYKDTSGKTLQTQSVSTDEKAAQPVPLCLTTTQMGWVVVIGWYKDIACTDRWNFSADTVIDNTTLYGYYVKVGDVNHNGSITSLDALIILQAATGKRILNEYDSLIADVNKNGSITSIDALKALQFSSGKLSSFS